MVPQLGPKGERNGAIAAFSTKRGLTGSAAALYARRGHKLPQAERREIMAGNPAQPRGRLMPRSARALRQVQTETGAGGVSQSGKNPMEIPL